MRPVFEELKSGQSAQGSKIRGQNQDTRKIISFCY